MGNGCWRVGRGVGRGRRDDGDWTERSEEEMRIERGSGDEEG